MNYTKEEREFIKEQIDPTIFYVINKTYDSFIEWYNDDTIEDKHKNALISQILLTATPSIMHQQHIRLEIIEYWKEKFIDYEFMINKLNKIS